MREFLGATHPPVDTNRRSLMTVSLVRSRRCILLRDDLKQYFISLPKNVQGHQDAKKEEQGNSLG